MKISLLLLAALVAFANGKALPDDGGSADEPEAREEKPEYEEPTIQFKEEEGVKQFASAIPAQQKTHYQAIHEDGQYSFGYAYPDQVHMESRAKDGTVSGSYFYTDPNGKQNQVVYTADETGFHVTANNLPVFVPGPLPQPVEDTPEVAEAKRQHMAIWRAIADHHKASAAAPAENDEESVDTMPADESPSSAVVDVSVQSDPTAIQTKPIDVDVLVDEEKDSIITDRLSGGTPDFDRDAEPIKLLAQLYAKHLKNAEQEPSEKIERPAGFYPSDLQKPYGGLDLFRRFEDNDDSVVVTNPEFVDLRAFVLLGKFRSNDPLADENPSKTEDSADLVPARSGFERRSNEELAESSYEDIMEAENSEAKTFRSSEAAFKIVPAVIEAATPVEESKERIQIVPFDDDVDEDPYSLDDGINTVAEFDTQVDEVKIPEKIEEKTPEKVPVKTTTADKEFSPELLIKLLNQLYKRYNIAKDVDAPVVVKPSPMNYQYYYDYPSPYESYYSNDAYRNVYYNPYYVSSPYAYQYPSYYYEY